MAPAIVAFVLVAGSPAVVVRQVAQRHPGFASSGATYGSPEKQGFERTPEAADVD